MSSLKEVLKTKIEEHRPRTTRLLKEYGDTKISDVTIAQAIGGARGVRCLVTDVSYLDPFEGIRFRGKTIPETFEALPKDPKNEYPYVEGFFHYLMTSEVPTMDQTLELVEEFKQRRQLPQYVIDIMRAAPRDTHPMTLFSQASWRCSASRSSSSATTRA
jgi:citrate synthase